MLAKGGISRLAPSPTGALHMGHAFNQTIMDGLTRHARMSGANTLWVPGTDHAGIATQIVVERQLDAQGVSRHDMGREKFVEKVWEWKEQSGSTITRQVRRMGASIDWTREYFTMSPEMSKAVTEVFVRLHEQGLIYRGQRLVSWDPVLKSAVSDLEVENEEAEGRMHYICYPFSDGPQPGADGQPLRGMTIDSPFGHNGKLSLRAEDQTLVDYALAWGALEPKEPFMSKPSPGNWKQIADLEAQWKKRKSYA